MLNNLKFEENVIVEKNLDVLVKLIKKKNQKLNRIKEQGKC